MDSKKIRLRFAPSPTGKLHIGATRTALFNFLYAKKNNGELVLRIEDTDKERSLKEHEDDIMRSLEWIGIKWDVGPFRQSERSDVYKKYVLKALEEGSAYRCFCSKEKLEEVRNKQKERKEPPRYEGECYHLSKEDEQRFINEGRDFVVRIRVPESEVVEFNDEIKGKIKFNTSDIGGDFVIAKKDLSPLYNFACAVDDSDMEITHVVRGDDHISNTPKQIIISKALGFSAPKFAHLPLILGPDKSKLSKRHGASSLYEYKKEGYLPEALFNFISLLGWNSGTDQEVNSIKEIIENFSIKDCQKSPAVFDINKLNYINGVYIRKKEIGDLTRLCTPYLIDAGLIQLTSDGSYYAPEIGKNISSEELESIIGLYQERLKFLSEIGELVDYFFKKDIQYEKDLLFWKDAKEEETRTCIDKIIKILSNINKWEREEIEKELLGEANKMENRGFILWPLRVALSGKKASAGPFDIAYLLGKEETLNRLNRALNILKK